MPRLPDVQGQSQAPIPQPSGGVAGYEPTSYRQGGRTAETLSSIGRDFDEASSIVAATNDRQDSIVAQAAANDLNQTRITQEFDPKTGFRNIKEGGTVGQKFIDDYTKRFEDSQIAFRDKLTNENQKRIYDQHAAVQSLQYKSALMQHQAQETEKFNDSTANSTIDLALRGMAQRPSDELSFQTGLAQINGTIDATGKRKNLPEETVRDLKAKYTDAAYSTRITSVMNGIPGVVQANPYLAEQMFKQVQDQLGVQSQVALAHQVQKSIQSVQARDTAQGFIFGKPPVNPAVIAPAITGKPLEAIVMGMESGGRDFDKNGNLLTSPKGAQGRMQVMPATAANPGFGIAPAKDNSPEELARVGRDYLGAMTARYNEPALVMAAYNAGPGQVDKWIATIGDPRTGQVSPQEWAAKIPFAETQKYVVAGLKKMNADAGQPAAPIQPPTANMLKTDLYQRVQDARSVAEQQYPGDTAYADAVAARVESYGRMVISNQQGIEAGARDGLYAGMIGTKPDGSDKPLTIDQMLADPQMKRNWDQATPETKMAIQNHFKTGNGDVPRTPETETMVYQLKGLATNDRDRFASYPLENLIGKVPHSDFHELTNLQMSARNKDNKAADKDINKTRALADVKELWNPIIAGKDKAKAAALTDQFTGRFLAAADAWHEQNGKWPTTKENRQIAAGLLAQGTVKGSGWIWDDKKRFFEVADAENFVVPIPGPKTPEFAAFAQAYQKKYNKTPTQADLQAEATKQALAGKQLPWAKK